MAAAFGFGYFFWQEYDNRLVLGFPTTMIGRPSQGNIGMPTPCTKPRPAFGIPASLQTVLQSRNANFLPYCRPGMTHFQVRFGLIS